MKLFEHQKYWERIKQVKPDFHLVVIVVNKSFLPMRTNSDVNLSSFVYSNRSLLMAHTYKYSMT